MVLICRPESIGGVAKMWTVAYMDGRSSFTQRADTKVSAIDFACRILAEGKIVMSVSPLNRHLDEKPISVVEMNRLYADWRTARSSG